MTDGATNTIPAREISPPECIAGFEPLVASMGLNLTYQKGQYYAKSYLNFQL